MEELSLFLFANKELLNIVFISAILILGLYLLLYKHLKKHFFIIALTCVYAVLSFYKLGSLKSTNTFYEVTKQDSYVIMEILDENKQFDKIYTTSLEGISNGDGRYQIYYNEIIIEGSNDLNNYEYITILIDKDFGKWNVYESENILSYKYIRLSFHSTKSLINEIALYNSDQKELKKLEIYEASDTTYNPNNLIDENDSVEIDFDYQNETFFDEIYHVRNAYEIVNHLPLYTAVHPLLGTRFIALGIKLFGMSPFGYRFFGSLVSVLLIPIIYYLAILLFKKEKWANITSLLFALDFMHLTTGRIATLEPFTILWILLMYIFMVKFAQTNYLDKLEKAILYLFLSGLMMSFSWATKWTGIYASIGLALLFFYSLCKRFRQSKDTNKIKKTIIILLLCVIFFVIIPSVIYVLSYQGIYIYDELPSSIPEAIKQVSDYIGYSFKYHSGLDSTHPYSSKWYMWLFDIRPIWYYVNRLDQNIQTISCFNNPIISIVGVFTMIYTIYSAIKRKDETAIVISLAYLSSLVPWIFISRTTFAYHYYPCIPFLILGIIYYFKNNKKEKLLKVFLLIAIVLFVLFLPVITGFETYTFYVSKILRFLPTWYFG